MTDQPSKRCFAHYHMTMAEYALYDIACAWSNGGKKLFFFDGPKLAAQFLEAGKSHMYKLEKSLVNKGWLVLEVDKSRLGNGHWSSRTYQVLTHEEYVLAHPRGCPELNSDVVDAPTGLTLSHQSVSFGIGASGSGILVSWTPSDDAYVVSTAIQYQVSGSSTFISAGSVPQQNSQSGIAPLGSGTYTVGIYAVRSNGATSAVVTATITF